jgi:hypothetical protein
MITTKLIVVLMTAFAMAALADKSPARAKNFTKGGII